MIFRNAFRPRALPPIFAALLFTITLQGACLHDWDAYDPRLGDGGGGAGGGSGGAGMGGAGGTGGGVCSPGETAPCYTGPAGTQGVGICKGGVTTCVPDGTGFGACEGEVTPSVEDCSPSDEDCDGQVNEPDANCQCTPGTNAACYGGPSGTEGVGPCQGGVQICSADGAGYGVCLGQVLPIPEDCATIVDDDCDGTTNDHCAVWSRRFGGSQDQHPWSFALDATGGAVIAGGAYGAINFGGGALPSGGDSDIIVAKLNTSGDHVWSLRLGDADHQVAWAVALDSDDNVYVAGEFAGTLDCGIPPALVSAGEADAFVLKLDAAGKPIWCKSFGDALSQSALAIAADATGVVVGGTYAGTIDFGAGVNTSFDLDDGFVVKLDPDGKHLWSLVFGNLEDDAVNDVAIDASGDVLVTGFFDEDLTLGGPVIPDVSGIEAFAGKLDGATGAHIWTRSFAGTSDQVARSIAADGAGNVLVAGWYYNEIDLGGGAQPNAGSADAFLVKLSPTGSYLWGKTFGDEAYQSFNAVSADMADNVLVGASMAGTVDFGGGPLLAAGEDDMVILKLNPSGALLWSRRFGDASDQDVRGIEADSQGNVLIAGDCQGAVNFGSGILWSGGNEDICVAKLTP